jgi:glutamyl-tRNA reductase
MKVQMIGCSHRTASIEFRERLAFSPHQAEEALQRFQSEFPDVEAVVLSTCNRTEFYTAVEDPQLAPSHEAMVGFLARFHGLDLDEIFDQMIERSGFDVVKHLFTVAASLDSMVVGEPQILSQVKQAYELANQGSCTGPLTHSIFQAALKVARRVANETSINEKRVSIPSVAVGEFARQIFDHFDDKRALVIGAGEMGEETVRYLQAEGVRDITIVNRSPQRGLELAKRIGGRYVEWDRLWDELVKADLVISTTGADQPVLTREEYGRVEERRYQRPLFVLDLAVPRDFDPAIDDCLGVYLYSLDDLGEVCERNREQRDRELPAAMKIVEDETARFMSDLHHRATGPIIKRLRQGWEAPKEDELRRLFNKLPELNEHDRNEITQSFDRLVNKLLHPPLESLRDESRHGVPHGLVDALKRLFKIDE